MSVRPDDVIAALGVILGELIFAAVFVYAMKRHRP
jgi:hypothetical protein